MKIKVIKEAFYNNAYKNIGDVLDYQGKNIPSWAKPIECLNKTESVLNPSSDNDKNKNSEQLKINNNSDDCDLQLKLEQYKNIGVDNNILLPVENLSVKDAVELFENEFKKKGIDLK